MRLAVCPGSFDPPTWGHLSLVDRGLALFDKIVVAVAQNPAKAALFPTAERVGLLRECLAGRDPGRVEVASFEGLAVEYARGRGAAALLRGLRSPADFAYEAQMAAVNAQLAPGLPTVFLAAEPSLAHLSSSAVRELAAYGVDLSGMAPPPVAARLAKFAATTRKA